MLQFEVIRCSFWISSFRLNFRKLSFFYMWRIIYYRVPITFLLFLLIWNKIQHLFFTVKGFTIVFHYNFLQYKQSDSIFLLNFDHLWLIDWLSQKNFFIQSLRDIRARIYVLRPVSTDQSLPSVCEEAKNLNLTFLILLYLYHVYILSSICFDWQLLHFLKLRRQFVNILFHYRYDN